MPPMVHAVMHVNLFIGYFQDNDTSDGWSIDNCLINNILKVDGTAAAS